MDTFVLRWTKDNVPFWQGVDDGEKIEINAVADVINENATLKRELKDVKKKATDKIYGQQLELDARKRDYYELIMAVGKKYEGETRHETAVRYILQAEQGSSEASVALLTKETNDD